MAATLAERYDVAPPRRRFCCSTWERGEGRSVEQAVADARDRGVAIRDATTFRGLDSHVRVAVRRPAENDRLLAALGVGDGTATDPSEADDV